jgi:four helix bundle protein
MALGSAYELQTQIFLSFDLELIKEEKMNELNSSLEEIQKMIYGLIKSIIKN